MVVSIYRNLKREGVKSGHMFLRRGGIFRYGVAYSHINHAAAGDAAAAREGAADHDALILLEGDGEDDVVRPEAGVKGGVQRAIAIEAGDQIDAKDLLVELE